jgi:hypothetical protein
LGGTSARPLATATSASAWVVVVTAGVAATLAVQATGARVSIDAPPLHGRIEPMISANTVIPVAVAAVVVAGWHVVLTWPWRRVLVTAAATTATWAIALASLRGTDRVVSPVRGRREYLAAVPQVHGLLDFLAGFVERIRDYPVHVQGHPPGTVLLLGVLRDLGLGGPYWATALFIAGGVAAVPAVLIAVREVAGESTARRAAPFVVLAPAAIWVATSADALYAGIAAWGAALIVLATGSRDRRGDVEAAAGGLLLATAAFGSYGMVLAAIIPAGIALARRRVRPLVVAGVASLVVVAVFAAAGFVWLDGLAATRERYLAGIAASRPYLAFLLIDLAALAIALGPATAVALGRLRDRTLGIVVGSALAAVAIADASGMAKGEVERIWLPFMPWLLVAGAVLVPATTAAAGRTVTRIATRRWLVAQAVVAIAVESVVRTAW